MSMDNDDNVIEEDDFIRPFLVTAGRTTTSVDGLKLETLVQSSMTTLGKQLRFEAARVHDLCQAPISIAEISAHLSIPSGVVKVVVGDLIESGHLRAHRTIEGSSSDDVQLISRLIAGVRRL